MVGGRCASGMHRKRTVETYADFLHCRATARLQCGLVSLSPTTTHSLSPVPLIVTPLTLSSHLLPSHPLCLFSLHLQHLLPISLSLLPTPTPSHCTSVPPSLRPSLRSSPPSSPSFFPSPPLLLSPASPASLPLPPFSSSPRAVSPARDLRCGSSSSACTLQTAASRKEQSSRGCAGTWA